MVYQNIIITHPYTKYVQTVPSVLKHIKTGVGMRSQMLMHEITTKQLLPAWLGGSVLKSN